MRQVSFLTNGSFLGAPPPTNGKDSASAEGASEEKLAILHGDPPAPTQSTLGGGHCQMVTPQPDFGGGRQMLVTPLPNEILGEVTGDPAPQKFWGGHRQKVTSPKMMVTHRRGGGGGHRLCKFICCVELTVDHVWSKHIQYTNAHTHVTS